jgi:alkyl hydroperoxide reductase subunit AhpC
MKPMFDVESLSIALERVTLLGGIVTERTFTLDGLTRHDIVDPEGIIRFVMVTDLSVGRNVKEVVRVLDALQTDELCPCNWEKGKDTLKVA